MKESDQSSVISHQSSTTDPVFRKRSTPSFVSLITDHCLLITFSCLLLPACSSTGPKTPPSNLRVEAARAEEAGREAYQRQNWEVAARSFEKAAEKFAAMDDYEKQASALHNQGRSLKRAGQTEAAITAYQAALTINQRLDRKVDQAQNLAGLAMCYRAQNKLDPAIQTNEDALKLAGNSKPVTATIQNDLALTLLQRGNKEDQDLVFSLLKSAIKINQSLGDKYALAANHVTLGRAYLRAQQNESAETSLKKALDLFRAVDDPVGLAHTHELLGKFYSTRGNKDKAKFHFDQAREKYKFLKDETSLKRLEDKP